MMMAEVIARKEDAEGCEDHIGDNDADGDADAMPVLTLLMMVLMLILCLGTWIEGAWLPTSPAKPDKAGPPQPIAASDLRPFLQLIPSSTSCLPPPPTLPWLASVPLRQRVP